MSNLKIVELKKINFSDSVIDNFVSNNIFFGYIKTTNRFIENYLFPYNPHILNKYDYLFENNNFEIINQIISKNNYVDLLIILIFSVSTINVELTKKILPNFDINILIADSTYSIFMVNLINIVLKNNKKFIDNNETSIIHFFQFLIEKGLDINNTNYYDYHDNNQIILFFYSLNLNSNLLINMINNCYFFNSSCGENFYMIFNRLENEFHVNICDLNTDVNILNLIDHDFNFYHFFTQKTSSYKNINLLFKNVICTSRDKIVKKILETGFIPNNNLIEELLTLKQLNALKILCDCGIDFSGVKPVVENINISQKILENGLDPIVLATYFFYHPNRYI